MSFKKYIPILKARKGEFGALQTLPAAHKRLVSPIIEVPPIPWDFEEKQPSKTIDSHLKNLIPRLLAAWGHDISYLDLLWLSQTERMSDDTQPLAYVFNQARANEMPVIPVVGLARGDEYVAACSDIIANDRRGACVRVQREDFTEFEDLPAALDELLSRLSVKQSQVDLLLDFRSIPLEPTEDEQRDLANLLQKLPALNGWRTLGISATSFPPNLVDYPPSVCSFIPRAEWGLWRAITLRGAQRIPSFGDYGIANPEHEEVDPRLMRPSASIRYTVDGGWLVLKARNLRDYGFRQFHGVCADLVSRSEYVGRDFSWGDNYIYDCAFRRVGTGNLTTWRQVGTSHHLTTIVVSLASRRDS